VIRIVGSHLVVELMRQGLIPEMACKEAVTRIVKRSPEKSKTIQVGFVALNKEGRYGGYSLQPGFTYSVKSKTVEQVFKAKSYYA
jgi:N4-(beta-N-acetylglucosaminyl)-L-asparaginase